MPKLTRKEPIQASWDCRRIFIGIDPGQNGGLAVIYPPGYGSPLYAVPMPPTESDVCEWIQDRASESAEGQTSWANAKAVIEKVHSMPKQGVASSFKFGMGYGGLRMALIAAGIPFEEVSPQTWMKALGIPPRKKTLTATQWKHSLRAKAQQLFPNVEVTLKTADALLIALYCQRKYNGIS